MRHGHAALLALPALLALLAGPAPAAGAVAMDPEMAELAQMLRDSCGAETGADLALVERVNAGEDLPAAPEARFKCYIKCVMETAGMMADGAVDVEAVIAMLPAELGARNAAGLRACGTRAGADDCDTAFRTQLCWQQANKQDYFLI